MRRKRKEEGGGRGRGKGGKREKGTIRRRKSEGGVFYLLKFTLSLNNFQK